MNETPPGPSGAADGARPPRGGLGEQLALQTRAQFFKNWGWDTVVSLNRGACARGGAQHGANPQAGSACQVRWEEIRLTTLSLLEALDFLRGQHKSAPFLFFNGNTFADFGRRICDALFGDLPSSRRREIASAVAHYIAGVLDRASIGRRRRIPMRIRRLRPGRPSANPARFHLGHRRAHPCRRADCLETRRLGAGTHRTSRGPEKTETAVLLIIS